MPKKPFIVYLTGGDDPMDRSYQQPVRASKVEVTDEGIAFKNSDGELTAFFDLSAVRNWREAAESDLSP